jgi:hypothetical protein
MLMVEAHSMHNYGQGDRAGLHRDHCLAEQARSGRLWFDGECGLGEDPRVEGGVVSGNVSTWTRCWPG